METFLGGSSFNAYPIGSVYFTTIADLNPSTLFGGTWELIGSKLAVRDMVVGDGYALALSDGIEIGNMYNNPAIGMWGRYSKPNTNHLIGSNSTEGYDLAGKCSGVPTKEMLDNASLTNSGLIVDTETIYSWKRTA